MAERPPRGYNRRDKPLPHVFRYDVELSLLSTEEQATMFMYMGTSKLTADPKTIEVNPRNALFAQETGPLICYDSMVQMATIITTFSMTSHMKVTDQLDIVKIYHQNIHGAFEDSWTPTDDKTGTKVAHILDVWEDATNEDVIPLYNNVDLVTEEDFPVSTVNDTQTFSHLSLTTDLKMEGINTDIPEWFDALQFYTIAGKLKTLAGPMRTLVLTKNRPTVTIVERKFIPKNVQYGNPFLYFGKRIKMPATTEFEQILSRNDIPTSTTKGHVNVTSLIRYNEWNPDFDQTRM